LKQSAILLVLLSVLSGSAYSQEVIKEQLEKISDKYFDDTSSQPSYLIYPSIAYTPETNFQLGITNLYLFYVRNNKRNRLSDISVFTFYTLEKQYGVWFEHAIYTDKDKWFLLGKGKYQYFPLRYYGIGNQTNEDQYAVVNSMNMQVRERVLRKITGHFFAGFELDHQNLYKASYDDGHMIQPWQRPLGLLGSVNTGIGTGVVYDNRKNVLNPRKGKFAEVAYLGYGLLGSDFAFHSIQFDARYFMKGFHKKQIWAFQTMGAMNFGNVPFNMLALMGGENMMRGYYLGRYRDKTLLAAQAEYRFLPFPFSKRFGGALFTSIGAVAPTYADMPVRHFRPAAGFGARYLIFRAKDIFVRLDIAFTAEGSGYYFFIGEAF
jgi:outer membrane protein assembly factor BamA